MRVFVSELFPREVFDDAGNLHAYRDPVRVKLAHRPGHDLVKIIKPFELLARPEDTPFGMSEASVRMGEPRELHELAGDRIGDTGRPCLLSEEPGI
jgi:hypothetical protein